jgi:energy-converting hydrogenase Eha subunit A
MPRLLAALIELNDILKERPARSYNKPINMWKQWVNLLLGLAVIVMAYMGGGHTLRFVIVGVLIAVLSLWSALAKKA